MSESWWSRHILLTREERLLVSGVLLLALLGLGVRQCRAPVAPVSPMDPPQTDQSSSRDVETP